MKHKDLLRLVTAQWFWLDRCSAAAGASDLLGRALAESIRVEKEHRRFMKWSPVPRKYALSIQWAARYQVCRIVASRISGPRSWRNVCSYRSDFPLCGALQEHLRDLMKDKAKPNAAKEAEACLRPGKAFQGIDYAGDIALHEGEQS